MTASQRVGDPKKRKMQLPASQRLAAHRSGRAMTYEPPLTNHCWKSIEAGEKAQRVSLVKEVIKLRGNSDFGCDTWL
jgi:hypothetical protein